MSMAALAGILLLLYLALGSARPALLVMGNLPLALIGSSLCSESQRRIWPLERVFARTAESYLMTLLVTGVGLIPLALGEPEARSAVRMWPRPAAGESSGRNMSRGAESTTAIRGVAPPLSTACAFPLLQLS